MKKLGKVFKYLKLQNPLLKQNNSLRSKASPQDSLKERFPLAQIIVGEFIGVDGSPVLNLIVGNDSIFELLLQNLELTYIALVNQVSEKPLVKLNNQHVIIFGEDLGNEQLGDKQKSIGSLIVKNFKKYSRILFYMKSLVQLQKIESKFQDQINSKMFGREITID